MNDNQMDIIEIRFIIPQLEHLTDDEVEKLYKKFSATKMGSPWTPMYSWTGKGIREMVKWMLSNSKFLRFKAFIRCILSTHIL